MTRSSLLPLLAACCGLLTWTGCFNNTSDCVPSGNCTSLPPTTARLTVKATIDSENPSVPLTVYYGNASDSLVFFTDTLRNTVTNYDVPLDTKYSAVARYRRGALTILAVDGDRTKLTSTDDCGDTCYEVDDASLNLKLAQ